MTALQEYEDGTKQPAGIGPVERGVRPLLPKRGGPGRGQGRKPLKEGQETVTLSVRLTVAQREKLDRLGGAAWLRDRIDKAKE